MVAVRRRIDSRRLGEQMVGETTRRLNDRSSQHPRTEGFLFETFAA